MGKLRNYANNSAHNKYFIANKNDIDKEYDNYRLLLEELFLNINN